MAQRSPAKIELVSSYLDEQAQEMGYQDMQTYYTSLLSGGKSDAVNLATQYYNTNAQSVAEQASYDISGAYANYLKQQRNILSNDQLGAGFKDELTGDLQQQYQSAYSQVKAQQAASLTNIASEAAKQYSTAYDKSVKMVDQIKSSYLKEAETRANIYKFAEEQIGLTDKGLVYTEPDENGDVSLTPYGVDLFREYFLTNNVMAALEEEGLNDEAAYYASNFQGLHKDMFGFSETKYDPASDISFKARLSGMTDEQIAADLKEVRDIVGADTYKQKTDYNAYFNYYKTKYKLTDQDIKDVLLAPMIMPDGDKKAMSLEDALFQNIFLRSHAGEDDAYNTEFYHKKFIEKAQKKHKI
jgi:hypothetical protein